MGAPPGFSMNGFFAYARFLGHVSSPLARQRYSQLIEDRLSCTARFELPETWFHCIDGEWVGLLILMWSAIGWGLILLVIGVFTCTCPVNGMQWCGTCSVCLSNNYPYHWCPGVERGGAWSCCPRLRSRQGDDLYIPPSDDDARDSAPLLRVSKTGTSLQNGGKSMGRRPAKSKKKRYR